MKGDVIKPEPGLVHTSGTSLVNGDQISAENGGIQSKQRREVTHEVTAPDGGWGWVVAFGTFLVLTVTGGFMKSSGVMYLKLDDKFNEKAVTTAWLFSLFSTFHLIPAPIASALTERYTARYVVYFGTMLSFVGMMVSTYIESIYILYFTFSIVVGFGKCLIYTAALIIVTKYFSKRRGLATGIASAGGGVGIFLFPPIIDWLFKAFGYRGAWLILSGLTLETLISGAIFRPLTLHHKLVRARRRKIQRTRSELDDVSEFMVEPTGSDSDTEDNHVTFYSEKDNVDTNTESVITDKLSKENGTTNIEQKSSLLQKNETKNNTKPKRKILDLSLLKSFLFFSLCMAIFAYSVSMMITLVFLPPLAKSKGVTETDASLIISIVGISDTAARIISGIIFDLGSVKPHRLVVYNCVLFGLGLVSMLVPLVSSFHGFAAVAIAYGVLMGCYVAQKTVVTVDVIGVEKMPSAFGLLLLFQGLGTLIGPTVSGLLVDALGGYEEGFYLGGIGLIIGASLFMCGNVHRIVTNRRKDREIEIR